MECGKSLSVRAFDWDDSTLIREFDRIMQKTKEKVSEDKGSKSSSNGGEAEEREDPWLVGDYCRAVYEIDGQLYEAKIVAINENNCTIEYLGYGDKVEKVLCNLQESRGKEAREAQRSYAGQAGASNYATATEYGDAVDGSENTVPKSPNYDPDIIRHSLDSCDYSRAAAKKFPKANRNWPRNYWDNKRTPWHLGDYCRAYYPEDGWWYEAEILAIHDDLCTVEFLGYEDTAVVSLDKLSESRGRWTRHKQVRMANKYEDDTESDRSNAIVERKMKNTVPKSTMPNTDHNNHYNDRRPLHKEQLFDSNCSNAPAVSRVSNVRMSGLPPPPIPCMPQEPPESNDPALSSMLMSWFMAGYYTGLHKKLNRHGASPQACCCNHHH